MGTDYCFGHGQVIVMERMNAPKKAPDGLYRFGFVFNIKDGVYLKDLQEYLKDTDQEPTAQEIRERATAAEVVLLNSHGYPQDLKGRRVPENRAKFKAFKTGYSINGKEVLGWFKRGETGNFVGVYWNTEQELRAYARLSEQSERLFNMGDFCFDNIDDCNKFLDEIARAAIPESWKYSNRESQINHPILKSYLETIFAKLKKEDKVVRSADGRYIIFNTNLLDKFFRPMYIVAEVQQAEELEVYFNPVRIDGSRTKLQKYGFENILPEPPVFFDSVEEVVFNTSWEIEMDYDSLDHIIEKRRDRFPANMRDKESHILARKLGDAIGYALAIAQRNYKYIVPIYFPRFDTMSFIMPIFLEDAYTKNPDFALVLQTDAKNNIYIARTILDLDSGYQDARLIAKPDESWLNPALMR